MNNKRWLVLSFLVVILVAVISAVMASDGGTETETPRLWTNAGETNNAILSFDYSRLLRPQEDCFETVIEETLTNIVVGTNIAQAWIGFEGFAGTSYTLESFDDESGSWFPTGALLIAPTNGFYKISDEVKVEDSRRFYRVVAWTDGWSE